MQFINRLLKNTCISQCISCFMCKNKKSIKSFDVYEPFISKSPTLPHVEVVQRSRTPSPIITSVSLPITMNSIKSSTSLNILQTINSQSTNFTVVKDIRGNIVVKPYKFHYMGYPYVESSNSSEAEEIVVYHED